MRKTCLLGAALLALLAGPLSAQQPIPPVEYQTFTLDNGLRVIVHEDHSTPIVAVNVWYDVGSAHEEEGRSGFAHLFEHMLSQETEHLGQAEIRRLVSAAGGTRNATTNSDRTAYYEVLPSNRLNLSLWLHAERMDRLKVTKENFEREREVVKEERRLRVENQPYMVAFETLDTLVADWLPYDHTVIGSMADLNAATAEDVLAFYERYYVPNNATMVIAGDVTLDAAREMVERYLGDIPPGSEPEPLPEMTPTPRRDGERRISMVDELANTPAYLAGFNIPPHSHPDAYPLQLLSSIFSQGESSRLHQRLVKDEKAALLVISNLDSRLGPGMFFFAALPNQGVDIEQIEALVVDELDKLKNEGVGERELQKAKNQLRANQITSRLTVFSKAQQLHHYRYYHGDVSAINGDLDKYMDVTAADIQRVAREYLAPENRTVIIVTPPMTGEEATESETSEEETDETRS